MTIYQIVKDPELLRSYREWLNHPMTKMLQNLAVKFSRPVGLPAINGDNALYAQGHAVASSNFIRLLFEIEDVVDEQKQLAKMKIDPDYGLKAVLDEDGYAQPRRRSKKEETIV